MKPKAELSDLDHCGRLWITICLIYLAAAMAFALAAWLDVVPWT